MSYSLNRSLRYAHSLLRESNLLNFLVNRVLAVEGAILHLLEPLRHRALVARRGVVAALALGARQNREITHFISLLSVL